MAAKAKAIDFTNVKERNFNIKHLPEGDYAAKVTKVDDARNKADTEDMWVFTIALTSDSVPGAKGASFPYYCVLNADNYWKVRNLFTCAGMNVPKKRVNVDPNKVVNKPIGVTLGDDEYEGKLKSVIDQVLPLSEIDEVVADDVDDDDEDVAEEPTPKASENGKAKKKKKAKPPVDEDDDELEELEVEEL